MTLHPQAKQFLDEIRAAEIVPWQDMPVSKSRELFDSMTERFGVALSVSFVQDRRMANVPVRIYGAPLEEGADAIVYFHGGGWVLGSIESHDALCRQLASQTEMTVLSVHYRRPPEHVAPTAADDCLAVTTAVRDRIGSAGKLFVAGDSAGGNLAATVSQQVAENFAENGDVIVSGQVLIYPVIDHKMNTESYGKFAEGHGLTKATMKWFWDQYLGPHPAAETLRIASLAELDIDPKQPPALVLIAGYDVLRDEGILYASRLAEAGVAVETEIYNDMLHGFVHFAGVFNTAVNAMEKIANWINRQE